MIQNAPMKHGAATQRSQRTSCFMTDTAVRPIPAPSESNPQKTVLSYHELHRLETSGDGTIGRAKSFRFHQDSGGGRNEGLFGMYPAMLHPGLWGAGRYTVFGRRTGQNCPLRKVHTSD